MKNTKNKQAELLQFINEGIRTIDPTDNLESIGYINGNIEIKRILEENTLDKFISIVSIKETKLDSDISKRVTGKKAAYSEAIKKYKELYK